MSIEGQGHFFTIYFPGFVCFVLYLAKISGERLQDHWFRIFEIFIFCCVVAICDLVHDVEIIFHLSYVLTASGNLF